MCIVCARAGLDYVAHEDVLPYSSVEPAPIQHELFEKFLVRDPVQSQFFSAMHILKAMDTSCLCNCAFCVGFDSQLCLCLFIMGRTLFKLDYVTSLGILASAVDLRCCCVVPILICIWHSSS